MATILITGDDFAAVSRIRGVAEGLGHYVLHEVTTENVLEDVALNNVTLVVASECSRPFSEWEICEMLHSDPTLPIGFAVLLLHSGDFDRKRFSKSRFDGEIDSDEPAHALLEEIVRCLGPNAAPETMDPLANSGFD